MLGRKLDADATRALSLGAGAVVMSALTFVGSAQYAAIAVLPAGGCSPRRADPKPPFSRPCGRAASP